MDGYILFLLAIAFVLLMYALEGIRQLIFGQDEGDQDEGDDENEREESQNESSKLRGIFKV